MREKVLPGFHAYAVRYTSTTDQQWDEALCFLEYDTEPDEMQHTSTRASYRDGEKLITNVTHGTLSVRQTGFGGKHKTEQGSATTEEERSEHGSQPWIKLSGGERSGHWFLHGNLIANGHDVAYVRMIPALGQEEEEEIHDGLIFFLSKCSPPIEFAFYDSAHILIGKQLWDATL